MLETHYGGTAAQTTLVCCFAFICFVFVMLVACNSRYTGNYNNAPSQAPFFSNGFQNYQSDYGQFFLGMHLTLQIP